MEKISVIRRGSVSGLGAAIGRMSAETMLAILGLDESQRREVRRKVIEKNRDRGYYSD